MAYCGTATTWSKFGLVTQYIGLALYLSGFSTIGWMATLTVQDNRDIIIGLFQMKDCSTGSCATQGLSSAYENSSRDAALGLMIVVLVVSFLTTVLYSLYVATDSARYRCTIIVLMCLTFLAALFILIGVIAYAASVPTDFYVSYSVGLVLIASFLFTCAGVMLIPDIRNKVYRRPTRTRVRTPSTLSVLSTDSPPPRYTSRMESPEYNSPRRSKGVWVYKYYDDYHITNSRRSPPRESVKSISTPRENIRLYHVREPLPVQISRITPRRYGTPLSVTRYDYKAR